MQHELEAIVGPERAERALDGDAERSGSERPGLLSAAWSSRLLIGLTLVAALVVGAFLSLLTGSWWLLGVVLAVHFLGTAMVLGFILRLVRNVEAPSPTASAALEARGVRDPEGELNRLVKRAEGHDPDASGPVRQLLGGEEAQGSETGTDGADSVSRQENSWTPSSEPSRPVDRSDAR
jgi:hypothetical protein